MARERPEDGIASWSLVSCSAREMSVRKDETMQNLYERVLSLRVRVRYGAYLFDSGGCGADDAIAAWDRHGHVTCIVYKLCPKRLCAHAPKSSSPPTDVHTRNTTRMVKNPATRRTSRLHSVPHSVPQTVLALIPLESDVVNLAQLAGANGILPVALMCCCMLGLDISKDFVSCSSRIHLLHRAYTHHTAHILITSRIYLSHCAYFDLSIIDRVPMDIVKYQD